MFSNINTINKFLQKIINHLPLLRFEIMISRYESPPITSRTFLLKACLTWDQRNTKRWDSLSKFDSFLNSVTRIFYLLPGHEKNEKIFKTFFGRLDRKLSSSLRRRRRNDVAASERSSSLSTLSLLLLSSSSSLSSTSCRTWSCRWK